MSKTSFSDDVYTARASMAAKSVKGAFDHDHDIKSGKVDAVAHDLLDPKRKNKSGQIIRESLDSDSSPDSTPVAILFDITGSMQQNPQLFQKKLAKLIGLLVKKGILTHPHVLFVGYGDATCDKVPLQIGQFELGNEMDEALSKMFLEGGGGGHITESADLAVYFMARHSKLDCVTKRGRKGYCFIVGDELPYPCVKPNEVQSIIGENLEAPILFSASDPRARSYAKSASGDILEELRQLYEVFWLMPGGSNHFEDPSVNDPLKAIFGQNLIKMPEPENICELIATTIGVCEGSTLDDIGKGLKDIGADAGAVDAATGALVLYASTRAMSKKGTVSGDLVESGKGDLARL